MNDTIHLWAFWSQSYTNWTLLRDYLFLFGCWNLKGLHVKKDQRVKAPKAMSPKRHRTYNWH